MNINSKKIMIFSAIILASLNLSAAMATSDKYQADKVVQVINVFDVVVKYPAPIWFKSGNTLDQSEFHRKQNGPQFIFEQIPKGDEFENWDQLYAIRGDYLKSDKDIPLSAYISMSIQPFIDVCGQERMSFQKYFSTKTSETYVMTCEDSPKAPLGSGYGRGIGEIALFHFSKINNTFVKVYHEWRGKSFSGKNPSSWPVEVNELKTMLERFKKVSISARK